MSLLLTSSDHTRTHPVVLAPTSSPHRAQNEEARLNTLKDALRRLVVVETSLLCNRQYDLGSLPKVMEEVSVEGDMRAFVRRTLTTARAIDLDVPGSGSGSGSGTSGGDDAAVRGSDPATPTSASAPPSVSSASSSSLSSPPSSVSGTR